jgi:hypothetical protein
MSNQTIYRPAGQVLSDFHMDSTNRVRVLIGPYGSGKTTSCAMEILRRAKEQVPDSKGVRNSRWLVIRRTYPELQKTTLKSWSHLFPENPFGKYNWNEPITHNWSFRLPDKTSVKAEIIFMALDGPRAEENIHGSELTGGWVNEAKEVAKPIIDVLRGRVGRYPAMRDGGPTWYGVIMDTNPPDDDHWLYKLAEKEKPEGWGFYKQPGGVIKDRDSGKWVFNPNAENLQNLPPTYYTDQMAGQTEDYIKVNLAGEYGYVREGRPVFPEYSDTVHVGEFDPVPGIGLHIGADWGLTPAGVIAQRLPSGQILIHQEIVCDGIGAVRFAEQIKRELVENFPDHQIVGLWGDPAGAQKAQTDESTVFQIMKNAGLPFKAAPGQKLAIRLEAARNPLIRMIDGKPGILIHRRCTMLRAALSGKYCYKRIQVTAERYMDKPDKGEYSHIADAYQYICLGMGEGKALMRGSESESPKPNVWVNNRKPKVLRARV